MLCRTLQQKGRLVAQSSRRLLVTAEASPEIVRKTVSKSERAALRAARREQVAKNLNQQSESATGGTQRTLMASRWTWYAGVGVPAALIAWALNDENSPPAKFSAMIGLTGLIESFTDDIIKPSHDKLLPDWSQMPNVPHDIPVPHTLVLDLENTLVSSTWDRKYGWRHAKRPGVDKFLMDMAQYYEIVLYSPSIDGIAEPVVNSLDKHGCIMHRLYRDATYYTNGVHVKDLNRLNRNVNRMIVLDDDPAEVQFNPENLLRVKPYTDPNDRDDNTLARITPFLIEIAREGYSDIPGLLRQYEGMDADEIADEQERRISYFKSARQERASHGLSGLASAARRTMDIQPELEAKQATFAPTQLTASDIVGAPPPKEENGIVGFLKRRQVEKAENDRRKFEKWNEVLMKKQKEKAEAQKSA